MKTKLHFFLILLLLFSVEIFSKVNSRLVYVSNTYDSPSAGKGTLIFDVEAISDSGDIGINYYYNSVKLDGVLDGQNPEFNFSDQYFQSPDYYPNEGYISIGHVIYFSYEFRGSNHKNITDVWNRIVRISIIYDMADVSTTLSWSTALNGYTVSDLSDSVITGQRENIPSELTNIPLPVELITFSAKLITSNSVKLKWETATEVNNYGFEIERVSIPYNISFNHLEKKDWEKIGFVEGAGNSNTPKIYNFVDNSLIGGNHFVYRLKQIDINGSFVFSDEVEVGIIPTEYKLFQNYPNPFNPSTKIRFSLKKPENVYIKIYNSLGEEIETLVNKKYDAGTYEINFNPIYLSNGIYLYQIHAGKFSDVRKMILLK